MGVKKEEKDFSMCTTGLEGYRRGNSWTCNEESHLGEMTLSYSRAAGGPYQQCQLCDTEYVKCYYT